MLLESILKQIVQEAYPDKKIYQDFTVRIIPKELKSKHGQYIQNDRRIEIYNLSRAPATNFLTALHEVAHHIEVMDLGETAHKETFYARFYSLVCIALKRGYLNQGDFLTDSKDSSDYKKLCHYYGSSFAKDFTQPKERDTVVVLGAYQARVLLKRRDFSYLPSQQVWVRKFETEAQAMRERQILESFHQDFKLKVVSFLEPIFIQTYYVAVSGAYPYREILRKEGFVWNGYGYKNAWIKKFPSTEYQKVCAFLKEQRLAGKRVPAIQK
ncbi:hypothetical protein ACNZ61_002944 [Enterococcus hirae]